MEAKKIVMKSLFITMALLSSFISCIFAISLLILIFNFDDKSSLYMFLGTLILTVLFWALTFYLINLDKNKSKEQKLQELKDLIRKLPLILASSIITSFYVVIYFFFFSFLTVSRYGGGGWGADATQILIWVFLIIAMTIFGIVMYRVFKTEKQDITLTLYNQFNVLKWSSLIALFFGIWSTYYFYHSEGTLGWIAMFVWNFILYTIYKFFDRLATKTQNSIIDSNLNRIIHEKKKKILSKAENQNSVNVYGISTADELRKLKILLQEGVITEEEFDKQKKKII
jgi:hypothetical protein